MKYPRRTRDPVGIADSILKTAVEVGYATSYAIFSCIGPVLWYILGSFVIRSLKSEYDTNLVGCRWSVSARPDAPSPQWTGDKARLHRPLCALSEEVMS